MASITLDYAPKPIGFHLDAGVGRAFDIMASAERDVTPMRFLKQAYIDVKPASWKGVELDFGKFVTFASAAVGTSMIAFGGLSWALDGAAAPAGAVLRLQRAMEPAGALVAGTQGGSSGHPPSESSMGKAPSQAGSSLAQPSSRRSALAVCVRGRRPTSQQAPARASGEAMVQDSWRKLPNDVRRLAPFA